MKVKGFTLIELLVVISIIAVLMSVMMPALGKAREQARKIQCTSQLKDMGTMLELYVTDNDGLMVSSGYYGEDGGRWWDKLGFYYGKTMGGAGENRYSFKVFMCPTQWNKTTLNKLGPGYDTSLLKPDGTTDLGPGHMYTYNVHFSCPYDYKTKTKGFYPKYWWTKKSSIQTPSTLPIYWDHDIYTPLSQGSSYGYPHYNLYQYGWAKGEIRSLKTSASGPAANHGKNINYLFGDGHAGGMGLWPYEDTLDSPQPADYYWVKFHPRRNLKVDAF